MLSSLENFEENNKNKYLIHYFVALQKIMSEKLPNPCFIFFD